MAREESAGPKKVLVAGASGTIGQAVVRTLADAGYQVAALVRESSRVCGAHEASGVTAVRADVTDARSLEVVFAGHSYDAVISCLASRTGSPKDARRIDLQANRNVLGAAKQVGAKHFVMLSAICVQKPRLAFQHAKLAFERELMGSGLDYTIIRPTAFFKSLSGQVERVRKGKPFLLFGDGALTRCKPISDRDLAKFIVARIDDPEAQNCILPIGGPGPAISPKEQGALLFELTGHRPQYRSIPPRLFLTMSAALRPFSTLSEWAAEKAEYLRIAYYYATESMLIWDDKNKRYSAEMTPKSGSARLRDHYRALLSKI